MSTPQNLPRALFVAVTLGLVVLSLEPLLDRTLAHRQARQVTSAAAEAVADGGQGPGTRCGEDRTALLRLRAHAPLLSSWENVGGCGAGGGGASSTSGGAKWIGRGVRGGRFDLQCIGSQTFAPDGAYFTTVNTRVATGALLQKWSIAANIPLVHKRQELEEIDAGVAPSGFGDVSLELTRKLGITNASIATLVVSFPLGAHDAVRQGVVLPQHLQLGAGVPSFTGVFEHTADFDGGLMVLGGSFTYGGWENSIKDFRAPSIAAYSYVGYMLGPFVPSVGLTAAAKLGQDREGDRAEEDLELRQSKALEEVPIATATVNLGLEWSTDWFALLLSAATPFSADGVESFTLSLGASTSLF